MDVKRMAAFFMSNGVVNQVRDEIVKNREQALVHLGFDQSEATAILEAMEQTPDMVGQGLDGAFDFVGGNIASCDGGACVASPAK